MFFLYKSAKIMCMNFDTSIIGLLERCAVYISSTLHKFWFSHISSVYCMIALIAWQERKQRRVGLKKHFQILIILKILFLQKDANPTEQFIVIRLRNYNVLYFIQESNSSSSCFSKLYQSYCRQIYTICFQICFYLNFITNCIAMLSYVSKFCLGMLVKCLLMYIQMIIVSRFD